MKIIESARNKGKTPDLRNAKLAGVDLNGENLSGVDFTKADLSFADLEQANLENAILQRANLDNANLYRAHMKNANLRRASLAKTHLIKPTLTNADLSEVDLKATNVNFDDANLAHVKLFGTDLSNIDLRRAILTGAEYSNDTIWPDDFDPEVVVEKNSVINENSLLLYFHKNPPYNAAKILYVGSEIAKDLKVEIRYLNSEGVFQTKTVTEFFPKEDPKMIWHHYKYDFLEPNQAAYFHLVKNKSTSNGKAKVMVSFMGAKSGKSAKIEKEFDLEVF